MYHRYRRHTILSFRLLDVVSGIPYVSDFINEKLGSVFYKRLGKGLLFLVSGYYISKCRPLKEEFIDQSKDE